MRIEVTQQDIDAGVRCDGNHCAIALAIARAIGITTQPPWSSHISVCEYEVWAGNHISVCEYEVWVGNHAWKHEALPAEARDFIGRFDDGKPVEPFAFELPGLEAVG